ncbi:hypothetical protein O0L34_g7548 [Tuta absoluta]|nr:hypothetical protein O0L34_g7548 [Tuta absoluta]
MENNQDDEKPYYVIRFIEIPYENIDNYICVPHSWVVNRRPTDKKVRVAYPSDEHRFDTRDRVIRNEKHNEKWKLYMAEIKYETVNFKDADYWIASRNDFGPLTNDSQSEPTFHIQLPRSSQNHSSKSMRDKHQLTPKITENIQKLSAKKSLKRATQSGATEQLDEKRRRQSNVDRPSGSAGKYINMGPGGLKRELSTVIGERDQTEAAAASRNEPTPSQVTSGKHHHQVRRAEIQLPSLPIIEADGPTDATTIDEEGQSHYGIQSREANCNSQSQHASKPTTASMSPPQPSTSVEQPPNSKHHYYQRNSQDRENSHSNFQPIITEVRSIKETDTNQTPCTDSFSPPFSSNKQYYTSTSHHLPSSLKMSARLFSPMHERPSSIPIHEPSEMRILLTNSERRVDITSQNPSNLMDQIRSSSASPPEIQEQTVTQNTPHFRTKIGKSYDMNGLDPQAVLKRNDNVASGIHTSSLLHQHTNFVRRKTNQRHSSPLNQYEQTMDVLDALQRPSVSYSIAHRTSHGEVLMHKASTEHRLLSPSANHPNAVASQSYQNNPGNFRQEHRQELRRTPTEGITPAQPTRSGIEIGIQTVLSSNSSPPQYYREMQQKSYAPQTGIPPNASNSRKRTAVQGVIHRSPAHFPIILSYTDYLRDKHTKSYDDNQRYNQRIEAILKGKPIDHDQVPSRNMIPATTGEMCTLERPSFSSQQDKRELLRSNNDYMCQPSRTQSRLIRQLPEMAMKQCYSESNLFNSSAVRSPPRPAEHIRQTAKRMEVDPLSPGRSSISDLEDRVYRVVVPEQETFTYNAEYAGTSGAQTGAGTSTNNQAHARNVLEQQLLDYISKILPQIRSNMYNSCKMYKNLKRSIYESADTYKKLMEVAERLNALRASESLFPAPCHREPYYLLNEKGNLKLQKNLS